MYSPYNATLRYNAISLHYVKWTVQFCGKLILPKPLEEVAAIVRENLRGNNMDAFYGCQRTSPWVSDTFTNRGDGVRKSKLGGEAAGCRACGGRGRGVRDRTGRA